MTTTATYDADVDAVVVELNDNPVVGSVPFPDDTHVVDLDEHGRVVAIEILTPHDLKLEAIAERFGLDNESVLTIGSMIARVMTPSTGSGLLKLTILHGEVQHVLAASPGTTSGGRSVGTQDLELEPA
jgi:uncharacterized protein YuzE